MFVDTCLSGKCAEFRHVWRVPKVTYAVHPGCAIVESGKKGGTPMKKKMKATLLMAAAFLCFMMTIVPMRADAAAKLNKTSVLMFKGKVTGIRLTGCPKKMKRSDWKVSGKAVKIIRGKTNMVKVRAVKYGTSTVKIKAGKKTLKCTVRVIGTGDAKSKVSLKKGSTSVIEVGKAAKVTTCNPEVMKVVKNGSVARLTAIKAGTAKITIRKGSTVVTFTITVPGKNTVMEESEIPEILNAPETEPENEKIKETEAGESGSETVRNPETEPDTEEEITHVVRRKVSVGQLYYCNAEDYEVFYPSFFRPTWTAEQANTWIQTLGNDERMFAEQKVLESDYPKEYKTKLISILEREVDLTDEVKEKVRDEFFDVLEEHVIVCKASTSDWPVYYYGPWEYLTDSQYEAWKQLNNAE